MLVGLSKAPLNARLWALAQTAFAIGVGQRQSSTARFSVGASNRPDSAEVCEPPKQPFTVDAERAVNLGKSGTRWKRRCAHNAFSQGALQTVNA